MKDAERIISLASGEIPPKSGMEIHFLRVLKGDALPCSAEEREWLKIWQEHNGYPYLAAETRGTNNLSEALKQSETTRANLNEQPDRSKKKIEELEDRVKVLTNENGALKAQMAKVSAEEWERIETIDRAKKEAYAKKQRIEYEKRDELAKRIAAQQIGHGYRSQAVYSTTDGQD
jgi:septal ring factor EnvC (AmiA/AmiB activator)